MTAAANSNRPQTLMQVAAWVSPEEKAEFEALAQRESRSVCGQLRFMIRALLDSERAAA